jgi:hypothetical protein
MANLDSQAGYRVLGLVQSAVEADEAESHVVIALNLRIL